MADYVKKTVGIGAVANDSTGDDLRTGMDKINDNFDAIFNAITVDDALKIVTLPGTSVSTSDIFTIESPNLTTGSSFKIDASNGNATNSAPVMEIEKVGNFGATADMLKITQSDNGKGIDVTVTRPQIGINITSLGTGLANESTSVTSPSLTSLSSNAAFTGDVTQINATRAASTAFDFLTCAANAVVRMRVDGVGDLTNTNNAYGAISDLKLKTNITDYLSDQIEDIKALSDALVHFNLRDDPNGQRLLGFVAQRLEDIDIGGLVREKQDTEIKQRQQTTEDGTLIFEQIHDTDENGNLIFSVENQKIKVPSLDENGNYEYEDVVIGKDINDKDVTETRHIFKNKPVKINKPVYKKGKPIMEDYISPIFDDDNNPVMTKSIVYSVLPLKLLRAVGTLISRVEELEK